MKFKDLNKLREERLMKALKSGRIPSYSEMADIVMAQTYPNGTRVLFYMDENHGVNKALPQVGVIQKLVEHDRHGREVYEIFVEELGHSMTHHFYIVEVLKDEEKADK